MKIGDGRKIFCIAMFMLVLLAAGAATVFASDNESLRNLSGMRRWAEYKEGFDCRNRPHQTHTYLRRGGYAIFRTTLYWGNHYIIMAAGDSTVSDLDVFLYDQNRNLIDRDRDPDAKPIVQVIPRWSGLFYIKVKMYSGSGYSHLDICAR